MYLRRTRLMLTGQLNEKVNFFFETDSPDFGKMGDFSTNIFIQDAWLELNLHEAFQVDAGMLIAPFSHHGMQGATSLLALDYHTKLMRYAPGGSKVWRDMGVMARGLLFNQVIEYRLAVFSGVHGNGKLVDQTNKETGAAWQEPTDPRNPDDLPRIVGRLTLNVFDAEGGAGLPGFFYDGIYLKETPDGIVSPKKVLSFGGSVDWQRGLNVRWKDIPQAVGTEPAGARGVASRKDYLAANGDAFFDLPFGDKKLWSVNGQVNFYYYDHGDRKAGDSYYDTYDKTTGKASGAYTGYGVMSELGLRYDAYEPVISFDWFNSTKAVGDTGDYMAVYGGFNWWLYAHSTSIKLQGGAQKENGDAGPGWARFGQLQAQLLF